jgi:16S rRNA (guanine(966)-N(2))-methyltransferase RsmD
MRIIAGKYKSRLLQMPKTRAVRPMQDRIRESIFSILSGRCIDARVLDLFSGSGSMGIEALSRGAREVVFVEHNSICAQTIHANLKALEVKGAVTVMKTDALMAIMRLGAKGQLFDVVFLDPPYHKGLIEKCLRAIDGCGIITNSAIIVAHHFKKEAVPERSGCLRMNRQNVYGDKLISFYNMLKNKDLGE